MPLGKIVIGIIIPIFSIVKGFFSLIGSSLERVMAAVGKLFAPFKELFGEGSGEGFAKVMEFVGEVLARGIATAINFIARVIDGIANIIGGIFDVMKGIFTLDFSMIGTGLLKIFGGIIETILSIPLAVMDTFIDLFDSVLGIFGSIGAQIKTFLLDLIPDWVKNLLTVGKSDTAGVQEQKQSENGQNLSQFEDGGSIDDGIVQNGKIITTNPEDTLIATKTPGDLLGGLAAGVSSLFGGGGGSVDNTAMVSKLDELILAVRETRDVYMDGRKVTSGVSNTVDKIGSNSYAVV